MRPHPFNRVGPSISMLGRSLYQAIRMGDQLVQIAIFVFSKQWKIADRLTPLLRRLSGPPSAISQRQ